MQKKNSSTSYMIIGLFLFTKISFAQSVVLNGSIYSKISSGKLPFASIILKGSTIGAISDSQGNFKISGLPIGELTFRIEALGYKSHDTIVTTNGTTTNNLKFWIDADCEFNSVIAKIDISKNKPKLILLGGIAPIIYSTDSKFHRKFGVEYFDLGCFAIAEECIDEYNREVFKFLDQSFGLKWRLKVRPDVIGL